MWLPRSARPEPRYGWVASGRHPADRLPHLGDSSSILEKVAKIISWQKLLKLVVLPLNYFYP